MRADAKARIGMQRGRESRGAEGGVGADVSVRSVSFFAFCGVSHLSPRSCRLTPCPLSRLPVRSHVGLRLPCPPGQCARSRFPLPFLLRRLPQPLAAAAGPAGPALAPRRPNAPPRRPPRQAAGSTARRSAGCAFWSRRSSRRTAGTPGSRTSALWASAVATTARI